MSNPTIIATGTTYLFYDESVTTHDVLPPKTYKVQWSPNSGFSLRRVADLTIGESKIYGDTTERADRIIRNYRRAGRSLGALASGDKGMGKSLLMRVLADRFTSELNLPVVLVEGDHPGIADFLDMLPECMVVFDEFEKTFAPSGDEEDEPRFAAQQQFLGLFDGLSATKRLYVLTVNNVKNIDEHLVNRPGRLHHHLRFTYPSTAEVRAYLNDADTPAAEVDKVVRFSSRARLNFDHLRAIAFGLGDGERFEDIIADLNIKAVENTLMNVTATLNTGEVFESPVQLSMLSSGPRTVRLDDTTIGAYVTIKFDLDDARFIEGDDVLHVDQENVSANRYDYSTHDRTTVTVTSLTMAPHKDTMNARVF